MAEAVRISTVNLMNRGKKRKTNVENWQWIFRKRRRDKGEPYINKKKVPVPGIQPPKQVGGITFYLPR